VGYSGAGKSIINLIFRFYDVTEGEFMSMATLRELDLASWRSRIAMVSQDVHILTPLCGRISLMVGLMPQEEIVAAARQANANEFICNLPKVTIRRWATEEFVFQGQRQRISIARAILCNPKFLILDEATNALDSVSEHLIQGD